MNEADRAASRVGDRVLHLVGIGTDVEGIAGGTVYMAGGPVITGSTYVGGSTAGTLTGGGQEYGSCSFHHCPVGGVVDVGGVAAIGVDKGQSIGAYPFVGKKDVTRGVLNCCHTF